MHQLKTCAKASSPLDQHCSLITKAPRCVKRRPFRLRCSALLSTVSTGHLKTSAEFSSSCFTHLRMCPHLLIYSFRPRFLALVPLKLSQLQLLGSACLMVAWKVIFYFVFVFVLSFNIASHCKYFERCAKIDRSGWRQFSNTPTTTSRQMNFW